MVFSELFRTLDIELSPELLELALTHPSAVGEGLERTLKSNQRLEFLGDAIVGAVVAEHWYHNLKTLPEGELTQRKAAVVQKKSLAKAALKLGLGSSVLVGRGADTLHGRGRDAILADTLEAVIGAVFLSAGWGAARDFVLYALKEQLESTASALQTANIKNILQEYTQASGLGTPLYKSVQSGGPAHARRFASQVLLNGEIYGEGKGASKKEAECRAAEAAFKRLQPA